MTRVHKKQIAIAFQHGVLIMLISEEETLKMMHKRKLNRNQMTVLKMINYQVTALLIYANK